jgi:hypothetical protein
VSADTSEESVGMKTLAVPTPLRDRLARIQIDQRKTRGARAFWMIVEDALDEAGYPK